MAYRVYESETARKELFRIVDYVEYVLVNPQAAEGIAAAYIALSKKLERFPDMYPACNEPRLHRDGYRKASVGSYVVIYHRDGNDVYVDHIFHQSQDYARLI